MSCLIPIFQLKLSSLHVKVVRRTVLDNSHILWYYKTMNTYRILQAVNFAIESHKGQERKFEGGPYVKHCVRVAQKVALAPGSTQDMIIAALLHDVIEDCPHVDEFQIDEKFGATVYNYVKDLTHPPLEYGNRKARKQKEKEQLWAAPAEVHTIKCADIIDNIPSIVDNDKDFAPRFIQEKFELVPGFSETADPYLYEEAMQLIYWAAVKLEMKLEKENA